MIMDAAPLTLLLPFLEDSCRNKKKTKRHPNPQLSDKIKKLDLTDQEKQDLVAFMTEGLSSDFPKIEQGRRP